MGRRKGRWPKSGKWEQPVSPLQRARYEHRWYQYEACLEIRKACPGHSGKPCRLEPSKLSDYENLKRTPSLVHIQALCEAYQRSAEALGLITWRKRIGSEEAAEESQANRGTPNEATQTTDTYAGVDPEPHPEVDDAMRRSTFVKGAASITGAFFTDPIASMTRRVQESLAATRVSNRELESLRLAAQHHAWGYYELAAPGCTEALMTDWTTAAQLMQTPKTQTQARELSETFARLSGILGFLAFDSGQNGRAHVLFQTGEEAAREAGNLDLAAWLCDRHTLVYDYGKGAASNDPRSVVDLANRGLQIAGKGKTPTTARLHARAARGFAALGDRREVEERLGTAEDVLSTAAPGCWPSGADMPRGFTYSPELFDGDRAETFLRLGEYARAKEASEQEMALQLSMKMPGDKVSAVPLNRLNLATCHLYLKEPVEACYVSTVAVEGYTGVAGAVVLRRARRFHRELVDTYPDLKVTKEFTEFLRSRQPQPGSA